MPRPRPNRADFDTPWKEALQHFLAPFLAYFFPNFHAGINWAKGYESLEDELRALLDAIPSAKSLQEIRGRLPGRRE